MNWKRSLTKAAIAQRGKEIYFGVDEASQHTDIETKEVDRAVLVVTGKQHRQYNQPNQHLHRCRRFHHHRYFRHQCLTRLD